MNTTYSRMHKSMDCPVCGKRLIESIAQDKVACQDSECKFNDEWIMGTDIASKNSEDCSCRTYCRKENGKITIKYVEYF